MRVIAIVTSFVLAMPVASLWAQKAPLPAPGDTSAVTAEAIASGRAIFHGPGTCSTCHGPELAGTSVAPTLRAHQWRDAKGGALDEIYRVVTHGVPGTAMVSHPGGISDRMAQQVADYVWAVSHRGETP